MTWTKELVWAAVAAEAERLFAPWSVGRPEGWKTDIATKDMICVSKWLYEEMVRMGTNLPDRVTQVTFFHRRSRSEHDPFLIAAELLNEVLAGTVVQNRVPHKRWG